MRVYQYLGLCLLCLCIYGCSLNKVAYGIMHGDEPAAEPTMLTGMILLNTSSGDRLRGVIDFDYVEETDTYHYVRNDQDRFIRGVIAYQDAYITNGVGELRYNKVAKKWIYIQNGKTYDIYQHDYKDIEISATE